MSSLEITSLFSIGYANKPIELFIQQLQAHAITAVADVRSVPYSNTFHDYHKEALAASLKAANIYYVYLGEELGPRSKDAQHYDEDGQIQFDKLMRSPLFLKGMQRVQSGIQKGLCIALMCAEKDPADCHRSLLIAHYLRREQGVDVQHIKHNGEVELQSNMEARLITSHNLDNDLFSSQPEKLKLAWRAQTKLKAYRRP